MAQVVGQAEDATGNRPVIVTGGGPGMMEAANRGARDAGVRTVGPNVTLPHERCSNPCLTPGFYLRFPCSAVRKLRVLLRARAPMAFRGGFGRLDEPFEAPTLIQTRKIAPVPVILVGRACWRWAFDPDFRV